MVPSWTETLLEAGVQVVGRTRFCIHPKDEVKSIPVVGGTKDISWEKVETLQCDYMVLDREENPKMMADEAKSPVIASHVRNCEDVAVELRTLSLVFKNDKLSSFADRWDRVVELLKDKKPNGLIQLHEHSIDSLRKFGVSDWIVKPTDRYEHVVYVIWQKPYMIVTKETFIGSVLALIGLPTQASSQQFATSYPEVDLDRFDKTKTLFLFSSEPYPFHKKIAELKALQIPSAIVDGENFSWFGVRALSFLESQLR